MKITKTIGALTLGIASAIGIASANDDEKVDKTPKVPQPVQIKPIDKKEIPPLADRLASGLLNLSNKTSLPLMKFVSEDIKINVAKNYFLEIKKALDNNNPDLNDIEKQSIALMMGLPDSQLIPILEKSKKEHQDLVSAYLDFMLDPKRARKLYKDRDALQFTLHSWNKSVLPPGFFKEEWYPKIEKIISRIEDEKSGLKEQEKEELMKIACEFAAVELKKDSGIKNPKIYNSLLKTLDKSPLPLRDNLLNHLIDISVVGEAYANDIKESRVLVWPWRKTIKLDDSLMEPIEERIKKTVTNPPSPTSDEKTKHSYKNALWWAKELNRDTYNNRSNSLKALHTMLIEKVSKEKLENVPDALKNYKEKFIDLLGDDLANYENRQFYEFSEPHLKSTIQAACKALQNPNDSIQGRKVISSLLNNYYNIYYGRLIVFPPFNYDKDINSSFVNLLKHLETNPVKNPSENLNTLMDLLKLSSQHNVGNAAAKYLNKQIEFTSKINSENKGIQQKEIQKQNLQYLQAINQVLKETFIMSQIPTNDLTPWIEEGVTSLYKQSSKIIAKGPHDLETLDTGREIFIRLKDFPPGDFTKDNEVRRVIEKEVIGNFLVSLIEASKNLSKNDRLKFRSELYSQIPSTFQGSFPRYRHEFMMDPILQTVSDKCFNPKYEDGIGEFVNFIDALEKADYTLHRNMTLKITDLKSAYLMEAVKHTTSNLKSQDVSTQKRSIEELLKYCEKLKVVSSLIEEPTHYNYQAFPKSYISKDKGKQISSFVELNISNIGQIFVDNLATTKVITEINPRTKKNIVKTEAFEANIHVLKNFFNDFPEHSNPLKQQCSETISNRFKTESDSGTRLMLYRAVRELPITVPLIQSHIKKDLVNEASPLVLQEAGETLTHLFVRELLEDKSLSQIIGEKAQAGVYAEASTLEVKNKMQEFNKRLELVIKTGEIKLNEKTPVQNLILTIAGYGYGEGLESLLRENLSDELLKKLDSSKKPGGEMDPAILKTCLKSLGNSNSMLGGFGKNIFSTKQEELFHIPNNWSGEFGLSALNETANDTGKNITKHLENNLRRRTPVQNMPYISAALVELYKHHTDNSFDSDIRINELGEKLFKGTNEKLSMFELYEGGLQHRFVWKHIENCRADKRIHKDDLKEIESNCHALIRRSEKIDTIKNIESRKSERKDLGFELLRLNPRLYAETVTDPIYNAKLHFTREFIALAPEGNRRDYMEIVFRRFGLQGQIREEDLLKILDNE